MICPCACPSVIKLPSPRKMFRRSDPLMPITIYIVTWNVVNKQPEEDLKLLLGLKNATDNNNLPDIYAIGLQEIKTMPYSILMDSIFEAQWVKTIRLTLAPFDYVKIRVIRLQGLVQAVFVKRQHIPYFQDIETEYTRTGLGRMWGNKGAVSIRMTAFNCSICLINCHLAAHDSELKRRIEDYNSIIDSQLFKAPETESIFFHDYVFWFGDLNFRFERLSTENIIEATKEKDYATLFSEDQLHMVQQTGEAFSELQENTLGFSPTYKYIPGSQDYDTSRRPAWTDRILYKVNAHVYESLTLEAIQFSYESHDSYVQSDHKPVSALFQIKVFQSIPDRYVSFGPVVWEAGGENQITFYLRTEQTSTVWDWIGLYKADFTTLDDYIAYTWVTGRGIPQPVSPAGVAFPSDQVVNSWQPTSIPSSELIVELEELGEAEAPFAEEESSEISNSFASRRVSSGSTGTPFGIPSRPFTPRRSWDESSMGFKKTPHEKSVSVARRLTATSKGLRDRSASPMRRLSEHFTSAVSKLTSLFHATPKTKYVVTFPEVIVPHSGSYRLLYLSHGVDSIHGMSDPFDIILTKPAPVAK